MKYGLVNGIKTEAQKGAKGICPNCGAELIARCGHIKINHWAHKGKLMCDVWWENETEWHRAWKNNFPVEWQEVIHYDDKSGEKHIADTKTDEGWVLEFQHSPIKPEEMHSRNNYYKKIVWVVDGLRRQRDKKQLRKALEHGISSFETNNFKYIKLDFPEFSTLLMEWADCGKPVFLDFNETRMPLILRLGRKKELYLTPIEREIFVDLLNMNIFNELLNAVNDEFKEYQLMRQKEIEEYNRKLHQAAMNKIIVNYRRRYSKRGRL